MHPISGAGTIGEKAKLMKEAFYDAFGRCALNESNLAIQSKNVQSPCKSAFKYISSSSAFLDFNKSLLFIESILQFIRQKRRLFL